MNAYRAENLPPYPLGSLMQAVRETRKAGRDIIDLGQMNPQFPPPAAAVEKLLQSALLPHNHRYSSSQGITLLREAIATYYRDRFGVTLDPEEQIVVTFGVKEGLSHLLSAICAPGDTVILPSPSYPVHAAGILIAGGHYIGLPIFEDLDESLSENAILTAQSHGFFHRLEKLLTTTWPRPKLLVLSFPHNPTTATVEVSFFERLVEFSRMQGLRLLHDFAYGDTCFGGYRPPSLLSVRGAEEIGVEFYSLSKSFSLPGWRIAFCLGSSELVAQLKRVKSYLDFGIFQPLQIAAADLLNRSPHCAQEIALSYHARRDLLFGGIASLGWRVMRPRATPFLWAKLPERLLAAGGTEVSRRALLEKDLVICPGSGFDPQADSYVRFALVEPEHRLRRALERLGEL